MIKKYIKGKIAVFIDAANKYIPFESFYELFGRKKSPPIARGEVYSGKRLAQKDKIVKRIRYKKRGSNLRTKP